MPIEILKFIYKEVISEDSWTWKTLSRLPASIWANYWNSQLVVEGLAECKLDSDVLDKLHKFKRLQFILDLSNCVFDKLNQHSQKNIKEIKLIYEGGVEKIKKVMNILGKSFLEGAIISTINKAEQLCY